MSLFQNIPWTALLIGYSLGAISFPQIIARWVKGIDLREVGSRNVGGRNTMHSVGLAWGLLAGLLDASKGIAALLLAAALGVPYPASLWAGVAAVAGHNWPFWLGFRGGGGLAVSLGLLAWLALPEAALTLLFSLLVLRLTTNIALTAALAYPLSMALMLLWGRPSPVLWAITTCFILIALKALPRLIHILRTPGGLRQYFANPNQAYQDSPPDQ